MAAHFTAGGLPAILEIGYREKRPTRHEGPFLLEERALIESLAEMLRSWIEQQHAETQRTEIESQLRHAQKMEAVGTLAAGIAHDFNNQLTIITGYTELAADLAEGKVELSQSLSEIRRAAAASASLTRQLLTFSRKQVLQVAPIDVTATVRASGRLLQKAIGDDIVLEVKAPDEQLWIVADAVQLEHVLLNLVMNARDAMPHAGRITIEMHGVQLDEPLPGALLQVTPGEYVAITVSDTGVGMSKEVQARMFEPFFTTKAIGKGTGLGLAMVYGTVQQMRGSIWVYSEPDQGATFKMYFPRTG